MTKNFKTTVSSETEEVTIFREGPTVIIGERINPTGRKSLQEKLKRGDYILVQKDAVLQVEKGAAILDVNAGIPNADEANLIVEMIQQIGEVTKVPLCIDTANMRALEAGLQEYKGKALVNSVTGEEEKLKTILPLIKQYGSAVIGLTIDDDGIPKNMQKRLEIAERIIDCATIIGIPREDIVIDPLALSLGAEPEAGKIGLDSISAISKNFGVNITMGCSNISFGLPDRDSINAAFLTMAICNGLTCPITNPLNEKITKAILAADLCMGRDEYGSDWISNFRKNKT